MSELGDAVKKLTMTDDLDKPEEERMRMFAEYLQKKMVSEPNYAGCFGSCLIVVKGVTFVHVQFDGL